MFTDKQRELLTASLLASNVKDRTQGGRKVSYIEGWWAIQEANRIFGAGNWDRATIEMCQVDKRDREIGQQKKPGFETSYISKVRITVWDDARVNCVTKEGWGFGQGIDQNLGMAIESAVKEAETDAMKRALMMFGNPFGLALYDKDKANVSNIDMARIDEFEEALDVVLDSTTLGNLIREYTGDIIDLRASDRDRWARLNAKVTEKREGFKKERLDEAAKEVGNEQG